MENTVTGVHEYTVLVDFYRRGYVNIQDDNNKLNNGERDNSRLILNQLASFHLNARLVCTGSDKPNKSDRNGSITALLT